MNGPFLQMAECGLRISLIAAATLGCVALVGRLRPAVRAMISTVGLVSILVLTLLAAAPLPDCWRWDLNCSRHVAGTSADDERDRAPVDRSDVAEGRAKVPNMAHGVVFDLSAAARWLAGSMARPAEPASADWRAGVLLILAAGAVFGIVRLGWSFATALRIGRKGQLVPDSDIHAELAELTGRLGCTALISLRESAGLHSAATVGWPRATIVLPVQWREWSDEELRCVLAHELAHIARRDFATRCAALLAGAVHFYHPLVRWLARRVVLDQELAADEMAARVVGRETSYLQALSRLALREDDRLRSGSIAGVLPVFSGFLIRRIEMLRVMEGRQIRFRRWPGWIAGGLLVALAVIVSGVRGTAAPPPANEAQVTAEPGSETATATSVAPDAGDVFRRTPIDPSVVILPGLSPEEALGTGAFVIRVGDLLKRPGVAQALRETLAPALADDPTGMQWYWKDLFESDEVPSMGLENIDCILGNLHLTFAPMGDTPAGAPATQTTGEGGETRRLVFGTNLVQIRLRKSVDWQQLERSLPKATRERHQGVTFLKVFVPDFGAAPLYVFAVDDRTLAIAGGEDVARRVIEHRSTRRASPGWLAHWKAADGGLVTFLAPSPAASLAVLSNDLETGWLVPTSETQAGPVRVQVADPNAAEDLYSRLITMLDKSPCVAGGIDWADNSDVLRVKLHLACGTETQPQEARDLLAGFIAPMRKAALDAEPGQISSQLVEFLNSLSFAASDDALARGVAITANVRLAPEALLFGDVPVVPPPAD